MKLKGFIGEGLHGFLDIKVKFKTNLTFLVGINGSGKTTCLEAINSLVTPSFQILAKTQFSRIRVEFINDKISGFVEAQREDNIITLTASSINDEVRYPVYMMDPDSPSYKEMEHEQEYYRDLASRMAQHPVVSFINSLPTPMFLGLNRRGSSPGARGAVGSAWDRNARVRQNIFSGSLAQGVREAIGLAETQHRDTLITVGRLGEKLRRDMLLELLTVERRKGFGDLTLPSEADLKRIPDMRKGIDGLANILGLPNAQVREKIVPFLDVLEQSSRTIPKANTLDVALKGKTENETHEIIQAVVNWNVNVPEMNRIKALSNMVEEYNKSVASLTSENNRYLRLLSQFLSDSNKEIVFDDRGYISINLIEGPKHSHISSLSSGESQIFVILTHLLFNPKAQRDNVFIIDEPELSLHVQWQELFVDSVLAANPHVQYIMATHSPSIILDRDRHCVDVVGRTNLGG
jgi:predicted ATP-binding protein involved in virulence